MKVSRERLRKLIITEINHIKEDLRDLAYGRGVEPDVVSAPKQRRRKSKKGTTATGMGSREARNYAKEYLESKNEDPEKLKGNRAFNVFLSDRVKTYWPGRSQNKIKNEIKRWLEKNILNVTPAPEPKKPKGQQEDED